MMQRKIDLWYTKFQPHEFHIKWTSLFICPILFLSEVKCFSFSGYRGLQKKRWNRCCAHHEILKSSCTDHNGMQNHVLRPPPKWQTSGASSVSQNLLWQAKLKGPKKFFGGFWHFILDCAHFCRKGFRKTHQGKVSIAQHCSCTTVYVLINES